MTTSAVNWSELQHQACMGNDKEEKLKRALKNFAEQSAQQLEISYYDCLMTYFRSTSKVRWPSTGSGYLDLTYFGRILELIGESGDSRSIQFLLPHLMGYPEHSSFSATRAFKLMPQELKIQAAPIVVDFFANNFSACSDYSAHAVAQMGNLALEPLMRVYRTGEFRHSSCDFVRILQEINTYESMSYLPEILSDRFNIAVESAILGIYNYAKDNPVYQEFLKTKLVDIEVLTQRTIPRHEGEHGIEHTIVNTAQKLVDLLSD